MTNATMAEEAAIRATMRQAGFEEGLQGGNVLAWQRRLADGSRILVSAGDGELFEDAAAKEWSWSRVLPNGEDDESCGAQAVTLAEALAGVAWVLEV